MMREKLLFAKSTGTWRGMCRIPFGTSGLQLGSQITVT